MIMKGEICEYDNNWSQCVNAQINNTNIPCYCGNSLLLPNTSICYNSSVIPQCPIGELVNYKCWCNNTTLLIGNICNPYNY